MSHRQAVAGGFLSSLRATEICNFDWNGVLKKMKSTRISMCIALLGAYLILSGCQKQKVSNLISGDGEKVWDVIETHDFDGTTEVSHSEKSLYTITNSTVSFINDDNDRVTLPYE